MNETNRIIGITGLAGSGKDTFAKVLEKAVLDLGYKSTRLALSFYLKKIAKTYSNWNGKKDNKGRNILIFTGQLLGSERTDHLIIGNAEKTKIGKIMDNIGTRLKSIRTFYGKNQAEFGEMIDLTADAVSNIERNKPNPTIKTLQMLEQININSSWLLTGKGNMLHSKNGDKDLSLKELLPLLADLSELSAAEKEEVVRFIRSIWE